MKSDVTLLSVIHDEEGIILGSLKKVINQICRSYTSMYVCVSEKTSAEVRDVLKNANIHVTMIPKEGVAKARRRVLEESMHSLSPHYHYCDLDRLVTWFSTYPDEISKVKKRINETDYLVIGRTEEAFATHPVSWRETEAITNRMFSLELGISCDVTAGSCGLSKEAVAIILQNSKANMTDAEWALIIRNALGQTRVRATEVNGLGYAYINRAKEENEIASWHARIKLSYYLANTIMELSETST